VKRCEPPAEALFGCLYKGIFSTWLTADDSSHFGLHVKQSVDCETGTDRQDDIDGCGKQVTVQTENFPYQPLDPIAPYRIAGFPVYTDS